ncbi:MAG: hypothetical protein Q8M16_23940 [Pirellulaceae bacterium]|nr:hypothetical protein [Pirellulaceae bacterium]
MCWREELGLEIFQTQLHGQRHSLWRGRLQVAFLAGDGAESAPDVWVHLISDRLEVSGMPKRDKLFLRIGR